MKPFKSWLRVTILALTLVLSLAFGAWWICSFAFPTLGPPISWRSEGNRYTVAGERGWITLRRPPPVVSAESDRHVRELFSRLSNDDFGWVFHYGWNDQGIKVLGATSVVVNNMPQVELELLNLSLAAAIGPLLDTLEDPQRFVVAHQWLCEKTKRYSRIVARNEKEFLVLSDGLEIQLRPVISAPVAPKNMRESEGKAYVAYQRSFPRPVLCKAGSELWIDPAQLPKICRQWHERFDVRMFSIPLAVPTALFLWPTAAVVWRGWRRRSRGGRGLCPDCGYDLRASGERCPECGRRKGEPEQGNSTLSQRSVKSEMAAPVPSDTRRDA